MKQASSLTRGGQEEMSHTMPPLHRPRAALQSLMRRDFQLGGGQMSKIHR